MIVFIGDVVTLKADLPDHGLWKGEQGYVIGIENGRYSVKFLEDRYGLEKAVVVLSKSEFEVDPNA